MKNENELLEIMRYLFCDRIPENAIPAISEKTEKKLKEAFEDVLFEMQVKKQEKKDARVEKAFSALITGLDVIEKELILEDYGYNVKKDQFE